MPILLEKDGHRNGWVDAAAMLRQMAVETVSPSPSMAPEEPCRWPCGRGGTGGRLAPGRKERRDRSEGQSCPLHTRQGSVRPNPAPGEACARGAPRSLQGLP